MRPTESRCGGLSCPFFSSILLCWYTSFRTQHTATKRQPSGTIQTLTDRFRLWNPPQGVAALPPPNKSLLWSIRFVNGCGTMPTHRVLNSYPSCTNTFIIDTVPRESVSRVVTTRIIHSALLDTNPTNKPSRKHRRTSVILSCTSNEPPTFLSSPRRRTCLFGKYDDMAKPSTKNSA